MNHKRVERIWRREGLKVPRRQPKRGRLWLNDGSCVRRRPERAGHVWAYDFCMERTGDGRPLRLLVVVDEFTRECLSIDVGRKPGTHLGNVYEAWRVVRSRAGLADVRLHDLRHSYASRALAAPWPWASPCL